jgi:hypothetical protein
MSDVPDLGRVVSMALDRVSGTVEIRTVDGEVYRAPLGTAPFQGPSRLVRTEFLPRLGVLRATTDVGDAVEYDVPVHDGHADATGRRPSSTWTRTTGQPCPTRSTAAASPRPPRTRKPRCGWRTLPGGGGSSCRRQAATCSRPGSASTPNVDTASG